MRKLHVFEPQVFGAKIKCIIFSAKVTKGKRIAESKKKQTKKKPD